MPQPRAREPRHDGELQGGLIASPAEAQDGPWNPGIESPVSGNLLPLCTIFRAGNVFTRFTEAKELRGLTGLDYTDLVAFRPERLALHELLIRVSADVSIPDGPKIEDLGINFRAIVNDLAARYLTPRLGEIEARYAEVRDAVAPAIREHVGALDRANADPAKVLAQWEANADAAPNALQRAALRALVKTMSAILARHGRLWGASDLIASLANTIACNDYGSDRIGRVIAPWLDEAMSDGACRRLPDQAQPVVMNTKGASASGKSTLRPLQRRLAGEIGLNWGDFALISPDIWRKQLLDYASLGAAYKYAGAFTGDELRLVDQKLDDYMARKGAQGRMPHLLIDRFRFDSFAPASEIAGSNLLTRFGSVVYLFFMITPPDALVERAWRRGLDVGRYKAVDDTLAHSVEAYAGMPGLFFTWAERGDKRVHFEFLDNTVAPGERPRTVACGWNDSMVIFDVGRMLDVTRFKRAETRARAPADIFREPAALAPERNTAFLRECAARMRRVYFADAATGRPYLALEGGSPVGMDRAACERAARDRDTRAGLEAVAGPLDRLLPKHIGAPPMLGGLTEDPNTIGQSGQR